MLVRWATCSGISTQPSYLGGPRREEANHPMDWIGLLITACYVIAAGAGLDLALSATHSHSEKKEFARILNERFLRSHGDTTVPVFKVFFGTLEFILLRLLGPRLISSRLVIMVAAYSAVFFCAYVLFVILTGRLNITIVHRVFETRHGILTFFVLGAFSLLTNIILMAHTFIHTLPSHISHWIDFYTSCIQRHNSKNDAVRYRIFIRNIVQRIGYRCDYEKGYTCCRLLAATAGLS